MQQNVILPEAIRCNGEIYNKVGYLKMNEGAFLIAQNNKKLVNIDFTRLASSIQNIDFEIKNPTQVEFAFMYFIQEKIQEKLYNNEIQVNETQNVITSINRYINMTPNLLQTLKSVNLNGVNREMLQEFFNKLLKENEYFKKVERVESSNVNATFPQYDEELVTAVLLQQPNIDINGLINQYFNDFTLEQINILLEKYNIDEVRTEKLLQRKNELNIIESESNSKSSLDKRKNLSLPGFKESKEAAFIDTLLLSFTVGTICGIYLMYFILTIMS